MIYYRLVYPLHLKIPGFFDTKMKAHIKSQNSSGIGHIWGADMSFTFTLKNLQSSGVMGIYCEGHKYYFAGLHNLLLQ